MKDGLLLTYTQVGLIGTANFIGYLSLAVVGGFLAVRFGARRTIFVSLLVMGVSLFLTGLSRSFTSAFLMRLVTGMGNGGAVVPMMALTASWFAARKRGLAAGILTIGTGTGLSIVGLALPYVMAKFGLGFCSAFLSSSFPLSAMRCCGMTLLKRERPCTEEKKNRRNAQALPSSPHGAMW
jgi:MFS family permease